MIVAAWRDRVNDLETIRPTGSHANSLRVLAEGRVDAAAGCADGLRAHTLL